MSNSTVGLGLGLGSVAVSVVFFGVNFIPAKKYESGDGMFFQFIMCSAILVVGIVVNWIRNTPFVPSAMIGGAMWATGNVCVIPIIRTIGLGLGMLIWATVNMVCGWASGRFGFFGLKVEKPPKVALNHVGVFLCAAAGVIYVFVKTEVSQASNSPHNSVAAKEPDDDVAVVNVPFLRGQTNSSTITMNDDQKNEIWDKISPLQKRIVGSVLALISGVFYGFQFVPYLLESQKPGNSTYALDYIFAQLLGSYIASATYFLIYAILSKNKPNLYPKAVIPAILCGLLWAGGQVCWFIANEGLGEIISFPIITTMVPVITNLVTIFVFKEVSGRRNFIVLGFAFFMSCVGVAIIVISKI